MFQSTHPHGCDEIKAIRFGRQKRVSITHPHGVRHNLSILIQSLNAVSIHAPAWGATSLLVAEAGPGWSFNPRTRMGCDTRYFVHVRASFTVSIHAPAWGATISVITWIRCIASFNPRTRMGCDVRKINACLHISSFNPRTRMGCDPCTQILRLQLVGFNPRTRMGCDKAIRPKKAIRGSIPTGCDTGSLGSIILLAFQSTHPHRWTNLFINCATKFQSNMGCDFQ